MSEEKSTKQSQSEKLSRRDAIRTAARVAYVTPLVLAAVSVTERPAFAGTPNW